jgi:hypothetical protein
VRSPVWMELSIGMAGTSSRLSRYAISMLGQWDPEPRPIFCSPLMCRAGRRPRMCFSFHHSTCGEACSSTVAHH